ncbi:MAG TPA: archaeal proteasome endopeptidase complex subunit alpha [Thermoprotei archaeon]|nr:MAG: proteasome endopeptidase complex, archaeal, alpha subunit [Thermoprotei archaeon]HDI75442.1 archaeal proteasome endopeptidase complex subunit alpha [Thermoprotei archaeon]
MGLPPSIAYDRAITIFSPDGRLYQVEYAFEAVRKGYISLGVKCAEGVVLAVLNKRQYPLAEPFDKIQKIDEHVGLTFAGFASDARVLIDRARVYAQVHRLIYDEPIPIETLARRICDIKQLYTQYGGVRPFGVAFLIAGVDATGPKLYGTNPQGTYISFYAHAIGSGSEEALKILEKNYSLELGLERALMLALYTLDKTIEGGAKKDLIDVALVDVKTKKFKIFSKDEIEEQLNKMRKVSDFK